MKTLMNLLLCLLLPLSVFAQQAFVENLTIQKTNIDVTSSTVVGEITIAPETAGKVIVRFDGYCLSDPGDLIVLAASDSPNWGVNDGNTGVEAISEDLNRNSFSHTRVYDVAAGSHTFYAIAHNFVETAGDGIASIYGNLLVEFVPAEMVSHLGISLTGIDVSDQTSVGQVTINAPTTGKVLVWFDGLCYATPGDRIVLAASDSPSWSPNDGNVNIEAVDNDYDNKPFAHSRVYPVGAGSHTFYAVAHNYVETAGDGITSIYASLTALFIPDGVGMLENQNIALGSQDLTDETVLGEITINPVVAGKVVVNFDGMCSSTPGDRIILAASDSPSWSPNDGAVAVEAYDSDVNQNCFSHTRTYTIDPGSQTFYAVGHNYVETAGDGIASVYGTLTVTFVPDVISSVAELQEAPAVTVSPNPTNGPVRIVTEDFPRNYQYFRILDAQGQILYRGNMTDLQNNTFDLSGKASGLYILQLMDDKNSVLQSRKIVKGTF